jgi:hypothetical protein
MLWTVLGLMILNFVVGFIRSFWKGSFSTSLVLDYLTSLRKKSPTSKREGAPAPVKVGDEFRLGVA